MSGNRAWLLVLRLLAGGVWLFEAWPQFQPSYLSNQFADQVRAMAGPDNPWTFYSEFLHGVVLTHASVFAYLTLVGDAAVGLCLVLGLLTPYACGVGVLLNINYALAAGWMDRPLYALNALLIVLQIFLWSQRAGQAVGIDAALTGSSRGSRRY